AGVAADEADVDGAVGAHLVAVDDLLALNTGGLVPAALLVTPQERGFAGGPGTGFDTWVPARERLAGAVDIPGDAIEPGTHVVSPVDRHLRRIGPDGAVPQGAVPGVERAPDLVLVIGLGGGGGLLLAGQPDVAAACDRVVDSVAAGRHVVRGRIQYTLAVAFACVDHIVVACGIEVAGVNGRPDVLLASRGTDVVDTQGTVGFHAQVDGVQAQLIAAVVGDAH